MKPTIRTGLLIFIVGAIVIYGLVSLALRGYSVSWTGFADFVTPTGEFVRGKTFWDWMGLLLIPLILALGAFFLNRSERKTERELATDRQREDALQSYLDRMANLLIKENLLTPDNEKVQNVARIHTLTVLRSLDGKRKGIVIKFLYEANLIKCPNPIVSLAESNLDDVDLSETDLKGVNFHRASLNRVSLERAFLAQVDLSDTDLRNANLKKARLDSCNLRNAIIDAANLESSELRNTTLINARMQRCQLRGSIISNSELQYVNFNRADFRDAYLISNNFKGADFTRAHITTEQLKYSMQ